jgi:aminoglycoside phosphotransferase (APT) family kinase protein
MPMQRADITATRVADLVASQFPRWAGLPLRRVVPGGWDNVVFRLGDDLVVRLPSAERYAAQVDKEQRWLPELAAQIGVQIPRPVAQGAPGAGYPWSWSVYRWIEGQSLGAGAAVHERLGTELAAFLNDLHRADTTGGPLPGPHSFFRGGALAVYDAETRSALHEGRGTFDVDGATEVWEAALCATWADPPVWVHGDLSADNLLVEGGRLAAVLDFGCCAVGDPACDLTVAWTLLSGGRRAAFQAGIEVNESTWARARGWALWKAATTLVGRKVTPEKLRQAHAVVTDLVDEHRGFSSTSQR